MRTKRMLRKGICVILAALLLISAMPLSILAAQDDTASLCGVEPYAQGCAIEAVSEPVFSGTSAMKASGRTESWHGIAWNISRSAFTDWQYEDVWTLSMQTRSASGAMSLMYNLEFWYNDGTETKYLNASAQLSDTEWT